MKTPKELTSELHEQFELSDAEIATRVGSSQPTIWRLRNGKTSSCMSELWAQLAKLHEALTLERDVACGENKQAA